MLKFRVQDDQREVALHPTVVLVAGFTGRDRGQVRTHIEELRAMGVDPPASVPELYPVTPDRVSTDGAIFVLGRKSSGEAEAVLILNHGEIYVGVGSDHTDRDLERTNIGLAKQVCAKPLGREVWQLGDVRSRWDDLELRSWVTAAGNRELYQEGTLGEIMLVGDLLDLARSRSREPLDRAVLMCGTLTLKSGRFITGEVFEAELYDPARERRLVCGYEIRVVDLFCASG